MTKLKIAENLTLPVDVVTQTIAILAKRRAGKSYTMRRLVEQLYCAGQQVVLVDPKGDQWGVRSSADGKSPGLPFVILGGERADVPLEPGAGEVVAKLVVEERVSVLLDLSQFRKHEVATFMTGFLENLYRLKAREIYRTPMMLVIDEADAVAPQKPQKGEERMLGAAEDIVRRGGQRGIGCVLVTQRSAVLNKNVLTQAQMLIVLRTIAPQDLLALKAWIDVHGTEDEGAELMDSLPSLPVGDAWIWSPGWPTVDGVFKRVHVLPIETFDSGATPAPGQKRVEPKSVADVDLAALQRQMASTIERAKQDNPKELRRQLAERDKRIRELERPAPSSNAAKSAESIKRIEVQVVKEPHVKRVESAIKSLAGTAERLAGIGLEIGEHFAKAGQQLSTVSKDLSMALSRVSTNGHFPPPGAAVLRRPAAAAPRPLPDSRAQIRKSQQPAEGITKGQQKLLNALAELEVLGVEAPSRHQLGMVAAYNLTGGTGAQHVADLCAAGLVSVGAGTVALTERGRAAADPADAPTTLAELHARVFAKLSEGQRRIAEHLIAIYPDAISRADLGVAAGYNLTGGTGAQHVADLVTVGAARIPAPGKVAASDLLFPVSLQT